MNSHLDESVFSLQHGDTFNPNHNISNNAEQALPDLSAFVEEVPPLESFFGTPSPSAYGPPENAHLLPEKQPPKTLFLFIEQGPAANQAFQIVQGNCIIGRASIVDLCLQHPSVSRRHAQLKRSGNSLYVRDLGSQNGTYVNQQRIANEAEIFAGDSIIIGTSLLRLWDSLPPENAVAEKAPADSTPAQNSRASSYYAVLIASLTAVFTLLLAMLVLKFTHPPTQTTPPLHPTPPMAASLAPSEET
ncbi:MAG: FHA domain-containing protein, partial [Proteobacteria bacterium]|nr:FHA domain-containing protein [Pseudomonadota bacterium]